MDLGGRSATDVVRWILARAERPIITTSFGAHAAVLLHIVTREWPDIPVVWIDHGFNTNETYRIRPRAYGPAQPEYADIRAPALARLDHGLARWRSRC